MKKANLICLMLLCFVLSIADSAYGEKPVPKIYPEGPDYVNRKDLPNIYKPIHITKKPGHYTITDWDEAIDETWGWGLYKSQKLYILNTFWNKIDDEFACFVDHPDYYPGWWDSLRTVYLDEINNGDPTYGVSRGRFAAIMNHLAIALKETHSWAKDLLVNTQTSLEPGIPLLVVGAYADNGHFGAGLTPLPDSSLLVLRTVQDHPLGLEPGDIVLGYDGIAWKELYQELIEAQLPLYLSLGCFPGSSESSYTHSWLKTAGMNWHLFDTLDIVKYSTGDTLNLSVDPLIGQYVEFWCTERMDIPGVPTPDYLAGDRSTFGIIEGTGIGYICVAGWMGSNAEPQFLNAINTLMNDYETTGLIIDFRGAFGGAVRAATPGFKLLFNTRESVFGWVKRCSANDHLTLCPCYLGQDKIYGSPNSYYDKPIAVLTGPCALSASDFIPYMLRLHPMSRHFGKPTMGAFSFADYLYISGWDIRYTNYNSYLVSDPINYLSHSEIEVDENVWLTPDDVAQGNDTVVEAATSWINSLQGTQPDMAIDPPDFDVSLEYGEVASQDLTITNNGTRHLFYSLTPVIDGRLRLRDNIERQLAVSTSTPQSEDFMSGNTIKTGSLDMPLGAEKIIDFTSKENFKSHTIDEPQVPPTILGHAGPDDFGHVWIDSDQPHGPSFNWVDISGIGTPVNLGDDSYVGPIDIGFEFPFYENSYSQLYICSNGYITFGSVYVDYINDPIPNPNSPNNFIAPWWDDLNPSAYGNIYYYYDINHNCFIVSFVGVPKFYGGGGRGSVTLEAILHPDGIIELNYLYMFHEANYWGDYNSATIGIENSDGSDGLEIDFYTPYNVMDSTSIIITANWLSVSPYSSYIAPGENEDATVTFSAKHLDPGTYTGNIYLDCNDQEDSCIVIPVTLEVEGYAYLPGDANMALGIWPPSVIGGDVTYLVGYFIGGGQAACLLDGFWCSADINGDCVIIGGDVTALVGYFVAGGSLVPCPDYEPVWPPLPDEAPDGWPNCDTPVINSKVIPTGSAK